MSLPTAKPLAWYWKAVAGIGIILILLGLQAGQSMISPYYARIILLIGINIILAVSLNLINGFTGQFSIGHAGFMAVGAYVGAVTSVQFGPKLINALTSAGVPSSAAPNVEFLIAIIAGALAAAVMGLLVGLPSLRLKGDYLAIATLGFGEAIRSIIENTTKVGGASGYYGIPSYTNFFWIYLFAVGVICLSRNIAMSTHGRALFAIREDELAADAVGVNTFKYKVLIFIIGAAWAGVAGVLLAHLETVISPKPFGFMRSIEIVVMVVLGGTGSITGAVIAAAVLTTLPELLREFSDYRMVIYSVMIVILMLTRPQGLFGRHEFGGRAFVKRLLGRKSASQEAPNGTP